MVASISAGGQIATSGSATGGAITTSCSNPPAGKVVMVASISAGGQTATSGSATGGEITTSCSNPPAG